MHGVRRVNMKILTRQPLWRTVFDYISTIHTTSENKLTNSFSDPLKCRSRCLQMFFKMGVLKNFANFTGKHLRWSLFSEVACLRACNFIIKRLQHRRSPVKLAKFLRTPFFTKPEVVSGGCFWKWLIPDGKIIIKIFKQLHNAKNASKTSP